MENINLNQATILAALVLTNIGAILTAFVSMRIKIAVLETNVDTLRNDIKNLGDIIRISKVSEKKEN